MSAKIRVAFTMALVVGAALAATAVEAKQRYGHGSGAGNVVGVWQCEVTSPVGLPDIRATLMFSNDRNVSMIGNNDQDGLIQDEDLVPPLPGNLPPALFATSKTPAYGRWHPTGRRKVSLRTLYYETLGLLSGEQGSGIPASITRLNCDVRPGRFELTGACSADVFAPDGDPVDGDPIIPAAGTIYEADCKRFTAE